MLNKSKILLIIGLLCVSFQLSCAPAGEMEMEGMDHSQMEPIAHDSAEAAQDRIPNEGSTITLLAPDQGSEFDFGQQIILEVAVENFSLGEDGNHWHVYINGESWGMVMGNNLDQPLSGLEPGEHNISVYLANGDHLELEEGDELTVTVLEE